MTILAKGQINLTLLNDGIGLSTMITYYYPSTSSVIQINGNWSTTAPTWSEDIYIWTKTRVTYTDGSMKESEPICLTGGKGTNGKGIRSLITEYYLSTSKFIQTGGSWITTSPEWEIKKYLWTRIKITYTDETINYTSPICDSRFNDLEVKVDTVINKQASIDTTLADITMQASETMEKLYHYSAGAGNIFDDCAVSISKDNHIQTEISQSSMPLVINKDVLRGREVVISVDIYARKAVPKSLSGYMGAYFTVTYNDNTSKKYMCAYYPGVRYLQQQLALGSTSIYQRIYTTTTIDDKAIKSVSNLTIIIACNGETLSVSNPKVEIGKEPVSGVLGTLERMRKAEMKITPEAIIQAVSEKIGKDGEIKTAKTVLNKDGLEVHGGGLSIYNNSNSKVFYADDEGNLILSGRIEYAQIDSANINIKDDARIGNILYLGDKNDKTSYRYISLNGGKVGPYEVEGDVLFYKNGEVGMNAVTHCSLSAGTHVGGAGVTADGETSKLILAGQNGIYINGVLLTSSDKRKKKNIYPIDISALIDDIRIRTFEYAKSDVKQVGVIAQDLLDNEFSDYLIALDGNDYYTVNYNTINMALVQKVQFQQLEINDIKKRLTELEIVTNKEE